MVQYVSLPKERKTEVNRSGAALELQWALCGLPQHCTLVGGFDLEPSVEEMAAPAGVGGPHGLRRRSSSLEGILSVVFVVHKHVVQLFPF